MSTKTVCLTSVIALTAGSAMAEMSFNRIASFGTHLNAPDAEESSAEIIDVTDDGMTLIYTDSPAGVVGMIDITDEADPKAMGTIALEGEPTAVAVSGKTAYIGVNTSESYTSPSGFLMALDMNTGDELGRCDLGGQPDSVATNDAFVAVAIENERDEDLGDGRVGQLPAGFLAMVDTAETGLDCDSLQSVDLTGLAEVGTDDPEPEFVDINEEGEVVVSLQENNHIVVVSAEGEVVNHFSAGAVTLKGVDTREEGALLFNQTVENVVREPDAVKWIDDEHFATANEGDMDGGSRGWTIFSQSGDVIYESGTSFEHALVEIGHYPEERSGNKGIEPESIEVATFDGVPMVFVGSERGSVVGVYDVADPANPVLTQLLPSGIGPEGYVSIPDRNLLISANEVDDEGPRAHVMLFEYQDAEASYPHLTSADADELIGWGAISGMVAGDDGVVYAVNDSFYGMQPSIFVINTNQRPARIVDVIRVTRNGAPAQSLDMEGITLDGEGGFYVASEGRPARGRWHAIYHIDAEGEIKRTIPFPKELWAVERRHAAEGITRVGQTLWVAIQREWDDDPANHVKIVAYDLETEEWGAVHYPKMDVDTGWSGLSEITAHGDWMYFIERDNQYSNSAIKAVTRVPMEQMKPAPLGSELPVVTKEIVRDLRNDISGFNGYIQDKVEGMAIFEDGTAWISTDNDGVDESSGETFFWTIGQL